MKLISRKDRAENAANAWFMAYQVKGAIPESSFINKRHIYENLIALGDGPNPDDVDFVIGNCSWTSVRCDECGRFVEFAVMVGEEPDYESNTATICVDCLKKALKVGETK